MMSLNRYRLRHLRKQHKGARRADKLLRTPDRLIALILIGNNAVNILAALVAGIIFARLFGEEYGVIATTVILTLIMLIFAEITPKTIAALHPERLAFPFSFILREMGRPWVLGIPVTCINWITNRLAKLAGVDTSQNTSIQMSQDELRTAVDESGHLIPDHNQDMLLNVLNLETVTVNDIMVPRNEVIGIDLNDRLDDLIDQIVNSSHTRLPVYEGDLNNIVGMLHLRSMNRVLNAGGEHISVDAIRRFARKPYFIPENTPLSTQLINFKKHQRRVGFVVDEYGDIEGLATLDDLLEEIVGDYTSSGADDQEIIKLPSGKFLVDGAASIRDLNKQSNWNLPTEGPKTINGLAVEYLESIPEGPVGFQLGDFRFETQEVTDKVINKLKVSRFRRSREAHEDDED